MVLAAWNLWNGAGHVNLSNVIHRLDDRCLAALGSLLVAIAGGGSAIDRWLAIIEAGQGLDSAHAAEVRR